MKLLRPGLYRRWNGGCYIKPVLLSSSSYSLLLSSSQSSPLSIVKLVDNPFIEAGVVSSLKGDSIVVSVKQRAMYERYCHRMRMRYDDDHDAMSMGKGMLIGQRRWYSSSNNNNNNNNNSNSNNGPLTGQEVSNMLLGLKGMTSDSQEVLALVVELTRLLKNYDGPLTGQAVI